ncbi:sulfite exporter TauE/SafE family protein [Nocardioides jishulii]|uniref:Probable membrane transporter protein n=1 Tax=Nocardioides jishulii TaxID=2575440 RepID=A0A4U2YR97_9ACTN|nr:sulfite exporter TauE/SafE family protein [Nocardioides jishulii]QCX26307.1 sulfite exporter TauE/SafE family protein [Nocardioides jishulii]TKI63888.1 sulfite exporter TauE/SafE family protein [Nocardioides jishulii]
MRQLIVLGLVGFLAQLIDGSLGMAYGVTSSTLLLAAGVAPAAASAAVHFSEIGTSLVSGFSHHKLGNVDWRTVGILAGPGFVGAFLGATLLVNLDGEMAKPIVACILLALGFYVVWRFLVLGGRRPTFKGRPSAGFLAPMGLFGGALDSIGGGGWGPVGTTTLLSSGRLEPRKVIGSIDTSEFVVAVGGSLGFLAGLGAANIEWGYAIALLVGGIFAAPIAAMLVRHLPARILGVAAGGLIIVTNSRTLALSFDAASSTVWTLMAVLFVVWMAALAVAIRNERLSRRNAGSSPEEAPDDDVRLQAAG